MVQGFRVPIRFVIRRAAAALLCGLSAGAALPPCAQERGGDKAAPFDTTAKQAFLFDYSTRTVLFEREADRKIAPASLAKLMTAAVVFREIKEGRLKLEDDMVVSADAWRRGGAVSGTPNMLLTPNRIIKVGELLTGLIVGGANDAALTLAENIAGKEERFAALMNAYAAQLKLANVDFKTATGLAAEGQATALRDLTALGAHVIENFPELYPLFAQRDMPLGKSRQVSRNPLLALDIGADGLVTGNSPEAGYALIGSAVQDGRRLIVAVAGLESAQERALEARKLLDWGFRRFEIRTLFEAGTELGAVAVYGGIAPSVPVRTMREVRLPLLRGTTEGSALRIAYRGPVPAPIGEGQEIARLDVLIDGRVIQSAPLAAAEAVAPGSVVARARDGALEASRQWAKNGFAWLIERIRQRAKDAGAPKPAEGAAAKAQP